MVLDLHGVSGLFSQMYEPQYHVNVKQVMLKKGVYKSLAYFFCGSPNPVLRAGTPHPNLGCQPQCLQVHIQGCSAPGSDDNTTGHSDTT